MSPLVSMASSSSLVRLLRPWLLLAAGATGCESVILDPHPGRPTPSCATHAAGPGVLRVPARQPSFAGLPVARPVIPPLAGGTLLVSRDQASAWMSDPDRDVIYRFDLAAWQLASTFALEPGSWPGRLTEDEQGRVHVVLRGRGAVVTVDPGAGVSFFRSPCGQPRGIVFEARTGAVHVACGEGTVVSYLAASTDPIRVVALDATDLRDIVVDGDALVVSAFHEARAWWLGPEGDVVDASSPPDAYSPFFGAELTLAPGVAWRMVSRPGGGVALAHQRGRTGVIGTSEGGYGTGSACDAVSRSAVSLLGRGLTSALSPDLPALTLPVDVALSPDGQSVAVVGAGQAHFANATNVFVGPAGPATDWLEAGDSCAGDGWAGPASTPLLRCCASGSGNACVASDVFVDPVSNGLAVGGGKPDLMPGAPTSDALPKVTCGLSVHTEGEPVALAFWGNDRVLVQSREPAGLSLVTVGEARRSPLTIFSSESRADVGFAVFHTDSGSGVACASCHPEGREDGRDWSTDCNGTRRTQDLASGVAGTEPFDWSADLPTFSMLMNEIYASRMLGPVLATEQKDAVLGWLASQPAPRSLRVADDPSSAAGRLLFLDPAVGCATCHAGAKLTNDATVDVGTGGAFQVPSLRGLSTRPPYMHNGCARTLEERFSKEGCGGGERHGHTAGLSREQVANLVAYLETL